jgi:serine/threonine protein phosphatase PrpC
MPEARSPHPTLAIHAAGAADIGRARSHNEDVVLVRADLQLWAVADGAGGHNAGNVASALAITAITEHFETTEPSFRDLPDTDRFGMPTGARRLSVAIRKANHDIVEISRSSPRYGGMGSTVVAASVAARTAVLHVAHVGDSRCYRLRGGRLEQLTHDHSLLNDIIEMYPDLDDTAVAKLPRKVVTRGLGMEEPVRVTVRSFAIAAEDIYLLCSDGLTGELPDEQIRRVLTLPEPPVELVERLISMANAAGGRDNIAAIVLAFDVAANAAHDVELAALLEPDEPAPAEPAADEAEPETEPLPDEPDDQTHIMARSEMMSAPEILLLGIESEVDPEEAPAFRVVPAESGTSSLFRALGDLLPQQRRPKDLVPCVACGGELPAEAAFCPRCGVQRTDGSAG